MVTRFIPSAFGALGVGCSFLLGLLCEVAGVASARLMMSSRDVEMAAWLRMAAYSLCDDES